MDKNRQAIDPGRFTCREFSLVMDQFIDLTTLTATVTQNPPLTWFAAPFVKGGRRLWQAPETGGQGRPPHGGI